MCLLYLGCEDQKTPMHISPGSERVLGGASEVGAAQETTFVALNYRVQFVHKLLAAEVLHFLLSG